MPDPSEADLPVLWSCWAGLALDEDYRVAVCEWLCWDLGVNPMDVEGVEVVVIDMPCVRVHLFAADEDGRHYLKPGTTDEIARVEPLLVPMRTPPPGYAPETGGPDA